MAKKPSSPVQKPIEFITPPNVLRAKLKSDSPPVRNPLRAAEAAVKSLSAETEKWVDQEIVRLQACRKAFAASPLDEKALAALSRAAMDVKGLAGLTGNVAADKFVSSLIALITDLDPAVKAQCALVEAHVDAIRATRESNHNEAVAEALAAELANQSKTFLKT